MVYYAGGMELEVISALFRDEVNDAVVCRDRKSASGASYLLLVIHDRNCAKMMLQILGDSNRTGENPCLLRFAQNEELIFVFPYREERKFSAFSKGQLVSQKEGERISVQLVMECLSTGLPWPLLYLALEQDCVQLAQDGTVYFTLALHLSELNPERTERSCVSSCTRLILELLDAPVAGNRKKARKPLKSYELIRKKNLKNAYTSFTELYHDIKLTALPPKKTGLKNRAKGVWRRNKDTLFRVLLVICGILVVIALAALITQVIYGEIPWLRVFQHTFDVIGTENLHLGGSI